MNATQTDLEGIPECPEELDYAQVVWDTLSKLDVSPHVMTLDATKGRPAIGYLPWHKAWMLLKREFPASTLEHSDDLIRHGGSVEVEVHVAIRKDWGDSPIVFTHARLAVMDFRFQAILEPNAREANDARQRCLVKALAFAGLGLDLWSESPVPVGRFLDPISTKQVQILEDLIEKSGADRELFIEWCKCELEALPLERYSTAKGRLQAKLGAKK